MRAGVVDCRGLVAAICGEQFLQRSYHTPCVPQESFV
jgi:hypothetical protein